MTARPALQRQCSCKGSLQHASDLILEPAASAPFAWDLCFRWLSFKEDEIRGEGCLKLDAIFVVRTLELCPQRVHRIPGHVGDHPSQYCVSAVSNRPAVLVDQLGGHAVVERRAAKPVEHL